MPADPGPLYAIAAELDRRAEVLRARAVSIGAAPVHTRWSSAGARAWAESVRQIHTLLLRTVADVEQIAGRFRARATEVCSWD